MSCVLSKPAFRKNVSCWQRYELFVVYAVVQWIWVKSTAPRSFVTCPKQLYAASWIGELHTACRAKIHIAALRRYLHFQNHSGTTTKEQSCSPKRRRLHSYVMPRECASVAWLSSRLPAYKNIQLWINGMTNALKFCQLVCEHAWISPHSTNYDWQLGVMGLSRLTNAIFSHLVNVPTSVISRWLISFLRMSVLFGMGSHTVCVQFVLSGTCIFGFSYVSDICSYTCMSCW